ncbi:GAF domain-containing protein [uncultured Dokdonia sp.]|uniref:GAF domain-containing protein n=1 Tax=uncultured Dokdonia sp. TaxID=575653 RepID=UPI00262B0291|nr:GAF domain-containing protein [uncultured Dokdonia sp.]
MAFLEEDFPMQIHVSFEKLVESYKTYLTDDSDELHVKRAHRVIAIAEEYPELINGLTNAQQVRNLQPQIDLLLADLFSDILQQNEIKIACLPFNEFIIKSSRRYEKIIKEAGDDYQVEISNFDKDHMYIMGCSIILKMSGYKIDFRRPFFYDIPDADGIMRYYRMLYNADYINIEKGPDALDITDSDVEELLDNFDNIDLWKKKFPPRSWYFKGFVLANLYDATSDVSLSEFKTSLLKYDKSDVDFIDGFHNIFQAIFNLPEIKVGFSNYNEEEETLERVPYNNVESFVLNAEQKRACKSALCSGSFYTIFTQKQFFAVSDVERYLSSDPSEHFYKNLLDQNIKSAIFAPISDGDNFLGLLEIVSPNKGELNSINANKLLDVMPYLLDSVKRSREQMENEQEVIIQKECTSIHPSVYWKFRKEAKRVMTAQIDGEASVSFRDIIFKEVYPLFGQVDIKGSSNARNTAVQKDLLLQLNEVKNIIEFANKDQQLPVYEEFLYRIVSFTQDLEEGLQVDSERGILNFLNHDVHPLFDHLKKKEGILASLIKEYNDSLEDAMELIYKNRKDYDESVMLINKRMAAVLDKKQEEAQRMYPHFFERFKTDGVEHNMYIGESITRENSFNKIYLYNLRLWQLQAMCEMENAHYELSKELPHPLDVASMILVFNTSLSVRFRMDEKRFDVDGTYNARYEVVKKRVDKAYIKGTSERVTQPGKIAIVYSQKEDEREYMRYIKFLQAKQYLGDTVEIVELQDLQAVTGLKAIRVEVLYKIPTKNEMKQYYTYDDLIEEIRS